MKLRSIITTTLVLTLGLGLYASSVQASLVNSFQFNGRGNWSVDAVGSNSTPVGVLDAVVPVGSTVVKAFLYSSTSQNNAAVPTVVLNGQTYNPADFTDLGANGGFLRAWRADATAQVAATIGGGSALPFTFTVNSESPNNNIDGEVLFIVYSNPTEAERTIAAVDGFSASSGDTTTINLASPLDTTVPGFEALLTLGIGFGFQPSNQGSTVDVNTRRLTSCAGGQDDGAAANGALITVGGVGDSATNPDPACSTFSGPLVDDELYNLALGNSADATPFLANGITSITIDTLNASADDNIFLAGINILARAGVNQPPPPATNDVPEPGTLILLGSGLAGLGGLAWRRRKQA